ncbi:hypothetical protein [Streptomyces roseolilacinus]|uniref:hypothetical protein n=1 Tax=Streptomyces roseolilacinus TaxID=66904 RepID=UPI003810003E
MGIESDQLVFDYLSRVGDLAQQRQLPSKARMSLVASLRDEIARQREGGGGGTDSPAGVRRILAGLGTPDAVVSALEGGGMTVPGPRAAEPPEPPEPRGPEEGPEPDWWSVVPGFTGGVEVPELLAPPKPTQDPAPVPAAPPDRRGLRRFLGRGRAARPAVRSASDSAKTPAQTAGAGPGLVRRLLRGRKAAPAPVAAVPVAAAPARRLGDPVLLLAAALLVAGTLTGSWIALAAGWLLAYATRRLSRNQAKWGVLGLPGAVAAGAAVWLWGRLNGRWGERIAPGGPALTQALRETWPWTLRVAALVTAAYLLWRARRR